MAAFVGIRLRLFPVWRAWLADGMLEGWIVGAVGDWERGPHPAFCGGTIPAAITW